MAVRDRTERRHLILVGLPGTGKTTVAPVLAQAVGLSWLDLDHEIEHRHGSSIPEMFEAVGESGFRERELDLLGEVLDGPPVVLATGGGLVTMREARRLLEGSEVVWLRASIETLLDRLSSADSSGAGRPLLDSGSGSGLRTRLVGLAARRDAFYAEVADVTVAVDGLSPEALAREILELRDAPRGRGGAPTT